MKRIALLLTLLLSLIIKPVMANDCCASVQPVHTHVADNVHADDHDHGAQQGEHEQMDVDADGNPHNGTNHTHSHQHHSSDFYRGFSSLDPVMPMVKSLVMAFGQDHMYPDYSPGPLLEPPSHA